MTLIVIARRIVSDPANPFAVYGVPDKNAVAVFPSTRSALLNWVIR